jgi:hypothetical protein
LHRKASPFFFTSLFVKTQVKAGISASLQFDATHCPAYISACFSPVSSDRVYAAPAQKRKVGDNSNRYFSAAQCKVMRTFAVTVFTVLVRARPKAFIHGVRAA